MKNTSRTPFLRRALALAILAAFPATHLYADVAYFEDFSSGTASADWSGTNLTVTQDTAANISFLGQLNNDTVTLTLNNLNGANDDPLVTPNSQGQHTFTTISYDLVIIGDWQGNNESVPGSPYTFDFTAASSDIGTQDLLTTTFSNSPGTFQTFPFDTRSGFFSQNGGTSANQINTLGFTGNEPGYNDSVYQMSGGRNTSFTLNQSTDDLTLTFSATNLDPGATWGITNVKVVTGGIFTWQTAPSVGDGLDGGWEVHQHWLNPDGTTNAIPGPDDAVVFNNTDSSYTVSIHHNYSVGYFQVTSTAATGSGLVFNTIGHTLTLTAGDLNNPSLAVGSGSAQSASLTIVNSDDDPDSGFNGVINAQTVGVGVGGIGGAPAVLTLDGNLDPFSPAGGSPGNVILNVQQQVSVGGGAGVGVLNIIHGAILNSGLAAGSASSNPNDFNAIGYYAYIDGTVLVDDNSAWNHTGAIWIGVEGTGSLTVSGGSQVNILTPPYAGQSPSNTGSLIIGGFAGSTGMVTVTDPGSVINTGTVQVGTKSVDATLNIDNLGTVNATLVSIGSDITDFSGPSANDIVNVTHMGTLNVTTSDGQGLLIVGDSFDGNLNLGFVSGTDGSLFNVGYGTVDSAIIGNGSGIFGEVDVNYAQAQFVHSTFTVNNTLIVGESGNGTLRMDGGGVTVVHGDGTAPGVIVTVGDQPGSSGLINAGGGSGIEGVFSQGSTLDASAGGIVLGNQGFGRLEAIIGGEVFAQTIVMAQQSGSTGQMLIQGSDDDTTHGTFVKVSDITTGLTVGRAGVSASVDITQGGLLDTFRATVGGQLGNMAAGSVTLQDANSLWLVHGQSFGFFSEGGTLDIGGQGLNNQPGGSGSVTVGTGSQIGIDSALQLAINGTLMLNGGSVTVGTTDPALMDSTPNRLHILANTTLPGVFTKVYGLGVIQADVLLDSGANIGPNGSFGGQVGPLRIIGSYHELSGGNLSVKLEGTGPGQYESVALLDSNLLNPAGNAT